MGDGVLAYFGYPQAHEHDAERAVAPGWRSSRRRRSWTVSRRSAACPRWHRHRTGRGRRSHRVGRRPGAASSARRRTSPRGCKGSPNRTRSSSPRARESCSAICSSWRTSARRTSRASAGRRAAWAALRASSVESRFEALHASGLTALVGREEEFELLLRRWSRAKTGEGQVVLLSGEAGIGKSRLDGGVDGTPRRRAAHAIALFLLPAAHRQRALSDHRPDGTRRRADARRRRRRRSSTSSMPAGAEPRPRPRTPRSSPRCCRCRTMDAILRSNWRRSSAGRRRWKRLIRQIEAIARQTRC